MLVQFEVLTVSMLVQLDLSRKLLIGITAVFVFDGTPSQVSCPIGLSYRYNIPATPHAIPSYATATKFPLPSWRSAYATLVLTSVTVLRNTDTPIVNDAVSLCADVWFGAVLGGGGHDHYHRLPPHRTDNQG